MPPEHPAPPPHPVPEWDCYIKAGQGPRKRAGPHMSTLVELGGMSLAAHARRQAMTQQRVVDALGGFLLAFVIIGLAVAGWDLARHMCGG